MYGGKALLKKCKIIPRFDLPDLIKLKRIQYPAILDLTEKEIIRAMNYAEVYEILDDGTEVFLDFTNFKSDNSNKKTNSSDVPVKGMEDLLTHEVSAINKAGINKARLYK